MQSVDLGLGADHSFRARSTIVDKLGQSHVRYDHFYRGVRVWEGDTIVHDGATGSTTTGDLMRDIHVATVPAKAARDAVAVAHQDLQPKGPYARNPTAELVIYPQVREVVSANPMRGPGGELTATDIERVVDGYTLAYYVHTELENGAVETLHTDYLIDADSGSILKKWDALQTAAANGTGNSEYSGTVTLGTNSISGGWELQDVARGMHFKTYNLNHGTSGTGTIYTDTDNTWGDGQEYVSGGSTTNTNGQTAAVDAHYGVAKTYDYFKNVHGRNGIDNANTATYSRVHYSSNYDNAFWSDGCFCMTYGDGSYFNVLTSLDVAGHEMAHGVTSRTANLTYSGESGGLNESMSDIAGTMVEFYARGGSGSTIGNSGGTWTIGEQLRNPPLRYMYKPSKDGASKDAWYSGIGNIDVHYSSGPMNRAFYFLSQGASSNSSSDYYSSYLPGGMTGVGNDHAARIAYRALAVYMTSSTNYSRARSAFLAAATDLYGATSADSAAVQNAFAAINVGPTYQDRVWPSASAGSGCSSSMEWFKYSACQDWKEYTVAAGQPLGLYAYTDSCSGCVLYHINFSIQEYVFLLGWQTREVHNPGPDYKGMIYTTSYTPQSGKIRVLAQEAFYLKVYARGLENGGFETGSGYPGWGVTSTYGQPNPSITSNATYVAGRGSYSLGNAYNGSTTPYGLQYSDLLYWGYGKDVEPFYISSASRLYFDTYGADYSQYAHYHVKVWRWISGSTSTFDTYVDYSAGIQPGWQQQIFPFPSSLYGQTIDKIEISFHKDHSQYSRYKPTIFIDNISLR